MSPITNDTVIGFAVVGCIGTSSATVYYLFNAIMNKTGPTKDGQHMKDYSGRFESDLLPIFVNGVTSIWYLGECLEESEGRFGFFNKYRYGGYLATCPLMMYELISTIGAPYSITMSALTFLSLLCALFSDLSTSDSEIWLWFSFGSSLFITIAGMLWNTHNYANKLNSELCGQLETMNNELKSMERRDDIVPAGMLKILTPMDVAKRYIDGAFYIMWILWPIFPLAFILEKTFVINRNESQVIYSTADLLCKTLHSICLDYYKSGLRQTIFSYGFLDTHVLTEIDIWASESVYAQLRTLSTDTYGNQIINDDGTSVRPSAGLDFHSLLVANQRNHSIQNENDKLLPHPIPRMLSRRGSGFRMNSNDSNNELNSKPMSIKSKKRNKDEPQFESECDECECGTSSFEINVTE